MPSPHITGPLVAAETSLLLGVRGLGALAIQVTGTFVGTLAFEVSLDGVNYTAMRMASSADITSIVTSTTGAGVWIGPMAGAMVIRVRMSAYTSGIAQVTLEAVLGPYEFVVASAATGAISASALGAAGTLWAPGDTALLPTTATAPTAAVIVVDTVTQSDPIGSTLADPVNTIVVAGDRTATYPNGTAVRIYGSYINVD